MAEAEHGPIWDMLDRAIKEVAEEEFQRLSRGLREEEIASHVRRALDELKKLGEGGTPAYDCQWVALFYLTWYQPRHINLVYSCLDGCKTELPERLLVVDLGCGALAMQFALAIFAATHRNPGARIVVQGIDPSRPMVRIGVQLWTHVKRMIRDSGKPRPLERLDQVMTTMSSRVWDSYRRYVRSRRPFIRAASDLDRWLTSVHAAYHLADKGVGAAADFLSPKEILVSSDGSKAHDLDSVLREMNHHFTSVEVQPRGKGCLRHTTEWRTKLLKQLWTLPDDLTERYLKNPVEWDPELNPIKDDKVRIWRTLR